MHVCSAKIRTNKNTQEQVHSRIKIKKQQGDARDNFPSITHFSEKQWQFKVIYFVQTFCI